MSNLLNKIPVSPLTVLGNPSVPNNAIFGTNFSVLSTGGYMEVYSLDDLDFIVLTGSTGLIEYSANTIPIQFNKGTGSPFSYDVITLNSDNISSGRRKIGMLVYVIEEKQVYQYRIDNYDTLWNAATGATGPGGPTVVVSNFGTTIKNNTIAGQNFIDAWLNSDVDGIDINPRWIKYYGTNLAVTGGTYNPSNNTLTLTNITGGTIPITGFSDATISAFTYNNNNTLTITDTSGGTFNATIDVMSGLSVNGTLSATTYQNLPQDIFVTGGTYSNGSTTYTNTTGGTFSVTGYVLSNVYYDSYVGNRLVPTETSSNGFFVDKSVNGKVGVEVRNSDNTGNGAVASMSVHGAGGLYDKTISVNFANNGYFIPYLRNVGFLYSDVSLKVVGSDLDFRTGDLINSTSKFAISSGGTLSIGIQPTLDNTITDILGRKSDGTVVRIAKSAITITDTFTTGFTYNNANTLTLSNNTGGTLTATIDVMSGLTINGNLISTTVSATTINGTNLTISGGTQSLFSGSSSSELVKIIQNGPGDAFVVEDISNGDASHFVINASGNTAIGLTQPLGNDKLTVSGNTSIYGTFYATTYQNLPISVVNTTSLFSTGLSNTGLNASGVTSSNFFGPNAGRDATNANYSTFMGFYAGGSATNANNSNFFGNNTGYQATNANNSNFIGYNAGKNATNASNSNLFGYQAGETFTGNNIGANNIIIGTNISLPNARANGINIGGVLFGSGTYSATAGDPSIVANSTGKIGINVVTPTEALHVSGNTLINGQLTANTVNATTSILPTQDITVNIGTPANRFREVNTYSGTTTIWSATTIIYSPTLDLGLDSLGNSRILTANSSILNNDVLLGGSY